MKHNRSSYVSGKCRCALCKLDAAAYQREWRRKRLDSGKYRILKGRMLKIDKGDA